MNRRYLKGLAISMVLGLGLAVLAGQGDTVGLQMPSAWARATPPGAGVAVVYGELYNAGSIPVTVVGMTTDVASRAQLHESRMEAGMMRMRHLGLLNLAPGERLELAPGGVHVMLMGLTQALVAGSTFTLTLTLEDGQTLSVPVTTGAIDQQQAP